MMAPHVVVESVAHVAPLGLGLWDAVAGRLASEGLAVRVFPLAGTRVSPVFAAPNRSGVFVAHGLPGLRTFESDSGDADFSASPPTPRPFLIEVRDTLARYTAFVLHVGLPAPRGLVLPACVADLFPPEPTPPSPPVAPAYVPLFGTAARSVPAGMTAVRATFVDAGTGKPAVFAVLEVRESGWLVARGIADERGEVAAMLAYPEPPAPPPPLSPPAPPAPAQPLTKRTWVIEIAVRYRRDLPRYTPDPARAPLPDLCELLAQPLAAAVTTKSPPDPLAAATLRYGEELVLGADAGAEILINPP